MSTLYILDTSVLINGWTKHYCPAVFPTIWAKLDLLIEKKIVFSCAAVFDEIERGKDDLLEWSECRKSMFHKPEVDELLQVREVMRLFPNFAAQGGSKNKADPFVIAHARTNGAVVVTDENNGLTKPTKPPKLPAVCDAMDVPWTTPIEFFERLGIRL